jgi:hypothetical protein
MRVRMITGAASTYLFAFPSFGKAARTATERFLRSRIRGLANERRGRAAILFEAHNQAEGLRANTARLFFQTDRAAPETHGRLPGALSLRLALWRRFRETEFDENRSASAA